MAEAHQGVAFSFAVTEDEGLHLNVSFEAFKAVLLSGIRSWRKMLLRILVITTYKLLYNLLLVSFIHIIVKSVLYEINKNN